MRTLTTVAVLLLLRAPALCGERFELTDLGKLVRVTDPQIAPDGKVDRDRLVSRPNYADNRYDAQLVLVDVASQGQRVLSGPPRQSASRAGRRTETGWPSWRRSRPRPQVFVLPMNGGEAQQLTKSATGVQQFAWSPDGGQIAYAASDEPRRRGRGALQRLVRGRRTTTS